MLHYVCPHHPYSLQAHMLFAKIFVVSILHAHSIYIVQSVGCELESNVKCGNNLTALCHVYNVYDFRIKSSKTVNGLKSGNCMKKGMQVQHHKWIPISDCDFQLLLQFLYITNNQIHPQMATRKDENSISLFARLLTSFSSGLKSQKKFTQDTIK